MNYLDKMQITVQEILKNKDENIEKMAAAYFQCTSIPPDQVALYMENTEYGVKYYFDYRNKLN